MLKKFGLAILILCTSVTVSGTGWAAPSSATAIEVSKTPLDYNVARPLSDGAFHDGLLAAETSAGKLVFYNTKEEKAFSLPAELKPIGDFHEQRAVVKNTKTNLYGYINTKGILVIPCQYTEANSFSEGKAKITIASTKENVLIDRTGTILIPLKENYGSEYLFSDGLALVYAPNTGKAGFINASGQLAIPYKYKYSRSFSDGLAIVQNSKGLYGYINTTGKEVIPLQYKSGGDFSEGLAPVQNAKGKWGFINKQGKVVIPFKFTDAQDFSEGLASVKNAKNEVGFIDKSGALVIKYQQKYDIAFPFKEGLALVGKQAHSSVSDGKFGYINRQGQLLTKLEYKAESSSFSNGYAVAFIKPGKAFIVSKHSVSK
ncbi:WG repeat-containing protein [Paenibacillus sp. 1-18]|uniref:WG repeat-containing protein n=1 Tax=Paenibacillus sp. 1-18 TaxID=1333846 RepID=UPI0004701FA3|nr:WG repeat-containing protein [Paenibacillus sp. 1-18]